MGLWCYLLHSFKQLQHTVLHIHREHVLLRGWAFISQPLYHRFFPNVNHEWNKHNSQHKNKKRWPGFKLKLALASDEQVSTVPPHHQCWFDQLVYTLSMTDSSQ